MALTTTVQPGYQWSEGEAITAEKLNAAASPTVNTSGTIGGSTSVAVDNTTIDQAGAGSSLQVKDGGISAAKLAEAARKGTYQYAAGTLSAGVYAVTLSPAATSYTAGMVVRFKADAANVGAVDVNVNGLGAKNIFKGPAAELAASEIATSSLVTLVYDGTNFQLQSRTELLQTADYGAASITATKLDNSARGDVHQYATGSLSSGVYAVTLSPAATAYTAGLVVTFKAGSANAGAVNLNVNALGEKDIFKGASSELVANDILANQVITVVYDGTQFQLVNPPNTQIKAAFASSNTTLATGLCINTAHSLPSTPSLVRGVLVCTTTDLGYAVGDEVDVLMADNGGTPVATVGASATNVFLLLRDISPLRILRKDTGALDGITNGSWRAKCYAKL